MKAPLKHLCRQITALLGTMVWLLALRGSIAAEPPLTRYQVEAIFLFNFARYVEWPAAAFPSDTAPMTIGIIGSDPFGGNLQHTIEGKSINGRPFAIKHLVPGSDLSACQILFISDSEASRLGAILNKTTALPILTVGDKDLFDQDRAIITFVLRNGSVRLEIDLALARKAALTISSKLLAVADVVKGSSD